MKTRNGIILAVLMAFTSSFVRAADGDVFSDRSSLFHGVFVDAATGVTNGSWIDPANWGGSGTIEVTGTGTWVIQIRGSNAQLQPADSSHGTQIGVDIMTAGMYGLNFKTRWIKARVQSHTSGTPSAHVMIGKAGTASYIWVDKDGSVQTTVGAPVLPPDAATETTLAAVLAKIIAAPATESTLASILAKIIAAPATEAKQDTANTSLSSIDSKDFATQTTLAAVLAKIIAAPSTEAKQDDLNALIVIIDAVLDAIKLDTANLTSDPATATLQTTLNALITTIDAVLDLILIDTTSIDGKVATSALQTSSEAILTTIDAVLDSILAKIIAAPSTEAKQDSNITNTTAIELNTDSPTVFAGGPVTVTSTATLISAASAPRRSLLIRNSDSNTVLFVGPTSGVTTDSGVPIASAGASGANGNGGTIIYTHTAAVWGIVASGTAEIRIQSESD